MLNSIYTTTSTNPLYLQKQASAAPQVETTTTVPVGQKTTTTNNTGLTVERTTTQNGPTLDTQTKKWFGLTDAQWAKLSAAEKQEKAAIAINGMITAYNQKQEKLGSEKRMTVAEQYALYVSRCTTEEEVILLTQTVKSMDKDNQLPAFRESYQYQSEELRLAAERILAVDYTELHEDNVVEAAKETANFAEENQVLAASNASNAPVKTQPELIDVFMGRKNEQIDMALSNQVGQFGINEDGTVDNETQLGCFEKISTSEFQAVLENTAKNICQLVEENKIPASQIIIATKNQAAINSIRTEKTPATTTTNFAKETKTPVVETVKEVKSESKVEKTTQIKIDEIKNIVKENNRQALKDSIKNLSAVEMMALMNQCSTDEDVLKTIIDSNPSLDVLSKAMELLENIDSQNKEALVKKLNKTASSNIIKNKIGFLSSAVQSLFVQEAFESGNLASISRSSLNFDIRGQYDELLNKEKEFNFIG